MVDEESISGCATSKPLIFYLFLSLIVPTFRLSGSSVLPAYPGFIVMNTAHDGLSASSTPSNMKRSACKKSR